MKRAPIFFVGQIVQYYLQHNIAAGLVTGIDVDRDEIYIRIIKVLYKDGTMRNYIHKFCPIMKAPIKLVLSYSYFFIKPSKKTILENRV